MFEIDFKKRISASECLNHPWFTVVMKQKKINSETLKINLNNLKRV